MNCNVEDIKQGIKLHCIKNNKYKTNLMVIILTLPLQRGTVTKDALIPAVLRRGTVSMPTQEEISKHLEDMYGASFDCGIEKIGDNHVLKFYMETLNDEYLPKSEDLLNKGMNKLLEIVFNPLIENNAFKKEYIETEKNNIKQLIESKIDNKDAYSLNRCVEEMYKNKEYGLYKYGYVEDLPGITAENLYEYYKSLISTCKIDIFVSGNFESEELKKDIFNNELIKNLNGREPNYITNSEETEIKQEKQEDIFEEKMDVTQGKIVIGLDIQCNEPDSRYIVALYNVILGESATSKMFQNVREKASLAYTAGSRYVRQKNNIYIRCGIEIPNYEKALELIRKQLEEMENGVFTEEDIENAKKYIVSGVNSVKDEQDSEITYYIGQELSGKNTSFEEYIEKINNVSREDVINMAKQIKINTIYFLRD